MAVLLYNKTDTTQLTTNFRITEFHCKGTTCGCETTLHDGKLSEYLQQIRDHFEEPVYISSGYRCATHNANVGGVTNSYHTQGKAADIYMANHTPAEISKYAEKIGILGIGLYETDEDGYFVHVDTRNTKSFWYGQAQAYRDTFGGSEETSPDDSTENENTGNDVIEDETCNCSSGMICEFSTDFSNIQSYTTENNLANLYIVTCCLNRTSPFYTIVLDLNTCKKMYNALTVRIGNSDSWLTMTNSESAGTVTFAVGDTGTSVGYISQIVAYR